MDNISSKKDNLSTILDFIWSALPGMGYGSDTTAQEVSSIISRDKKSMFVKIIPPIVLGWALTFLALTGYYVIAGPGDCGGHPGPFLPPFFCEGDGEPVLDAVTRFLKTTFWFIVTVEALLAFFLLLGKLAKTKYNAVIPKPLMVLFWLFVAGLFLTFLGLMIFG